jgi:hypothetical protein
LALGRKKYFGNNKKHRNWIPNMELKKKKKRERKKGIGC